MGTAELAQLQTAGVAPATRIDHRCVHGRLSDWYNATVLVVAEHLEWHLFGLMNAQLCYLCLCGLPGQPFNYHLQRGGEE